MALLLQDSSTNIWSVTSNAVGNLVTSTSSGTAPQFLFLVDSSGQVWQLSVTTGGLLQTTPGVSSDTPQYAFYDLGGSPNYALYINVLGLLQTKTGQGTGGWVPNGYGAGADNSVVGGGGGFMAYPQPPTGPRAAFNPPEQNLQAGVLNFTFSNGTGVWFQATNPGRSTNQ